MRNNLTTEQRAVLVHVSAVLRDFTATLEERYDVDKEMRYALGIILTSAEIDDERYDEGSGR